MAKTDKPAGATNPANAPTTAETPGTIPPGKPARRRAVVDPNEGKGPKFRRIAAARMTLALKIIRSIANLSGAGYEHTAEQRAKILGDLRGAVSYVEKAFENGGANRAGSSYSI